MRPLSRNVERIIGRIATAGRGLVTRGELLDADVTLDEIKWRLHTGALIPEYPGVYRVGHRAPSVESSYLAAVKACGEGALLSAMAAAHLVRLVKGPAPPPEVTTRTERDIKGVKTRRSAKICRQDATSYRGIPVTTVPRILVDIAARLPLDALARACHEAGVKYDTTPRQVEAVLARSGRPKGARKLRAVLRGDIPVTLSELEKRFLQLLQEHELPLPITNRPAGAKRVDCRWPGHRLTVELDSYRYHASRHAWENDRRREREAYARGDDFRRYTYGDVYENPAPMLSELVPLLQARLAQTGQARAPCLA